MKPCDRSNRLVASPGDPFRGLVRVSCIINSINNYRELLTTLLQATQEVMDCEAGSLMLYEEETQDLIWHVALGEKADRLKEMGRLKLGQGIAGWVAQNRESTLVEDATTDQRFYREADHKTGFQTRSVICVPLLLQDKLVGVIQALNPKNKKAFEQKDLDVFEAYAAMSATAIEKIRWQDAMLQQNKIRQDLEVAQEIQSRFLAHHFPSAESAFQLAIHYHMASQIGGDFYDVQELSGGRFALILGDVTGKGVSAALLMAQILSEFRHEATREEDPGRILANINDKLVARSARGMFATAWCAVVRPSRQGMDVLQASAGHLPPLWIEEWGTSFLELASGPPIGIVPQIEYVVADVTLQPGQLFCVYTDGITEGRNRSGDEFGSEKLQQVFNPYPAHVWEARSRLIQAVEEFGKGAVQRDDITFLLFGPRDKNSISVVNFHHVCLSCSSEMKHLRTRIRHSLESTGYDEEVVGQLVLAVDEACTNIIRHAYEGRTDGKIEVDVNVTDVCWEVRLRDYGKKCDPEQFKGRELDQVRPGGLGLHFMRQAFDEVVFSPAEKVGTCLLLKKKKPQ